MLDNLTLNEESSSDFSTPPPDVSTWADIVVTISGLNFYARWVGHTDTWAYLKDILQRINTHPIKRLHELLPNQWLAAQSTL